MAGPDFRLDERVVVVTGGMGQLGASFTRALIAAGARVAVIDARIDADRAKNESPYGTTIAHGFLTLSMIPTLTKENYRVENAKMAINYGSNKVRFIAAVPSGGRIRARSELIDAAKVDDNTVNLTVKNTIELDGSTKPAAIAETIVRVLF